MLERTERVKISVHTADPFLLQKIRLDAPDWAEITDGKDASLTLVDIDTKSAPDGEFISMSRISGSADIAIPFAVGTVEKLILGIEGRRAALTLSTSERAAYLRGEKIKLTELEYSLLSYLVNRGGEYSAREELISAVWGEGQDGGVINVYIHYLREKLERQGEKIILSSRKRGYKIDEKYLGGEYR